MHHFMQKQFIIEVFVEELNIGLLLGWFEICDKRCVNRASRPHHHTQLDLGQASLEEP
jgi:hypothetical protein